MNKEEYKAIFLKSKKAVKPTEPTKKAVKLNLPIDLANKLQQMSYLAGINKSCLSHVVQNILEDHLNKHDSIIQDLFAQEGINPR